MIRATSHLSCHVPAWLVQGLSVFGNPASVLKKITIEVEDSKAILFY
jgi:hypothetical protein